MNHSDSNALTETSHVSSVQELAHNPAGSQRRYYEAPAYSREDVVMTELGGNTGAEGGEQKNS